jgi:hypothetical protein
MAGWGTAPRWRGGGRRRQGRRAGGTRGRARGAVGGECLISGCVAVSVAQLDLDGNEEITLEEFRQALGHSPRGITGIGALVAAAHQGQVGPPPSPMPPPPPPPPPQSPELTSSVSEELLRMSEEEAARVTVAAAREQRGDGGGGGGGGSGGAGAGH